MIQAGPSFAGHAHAVGQLGESLLAGIEEGKMRRQIVIRT